jgi:hypothetical protein
MGCGCGKSKMNRGQVSMPTMPRNAGALSARPIAHQNRVPTRQQTAPPHIVQSQALKNRQAARQQV